MNDNSNPAHVWADVQVTAEDSDGDDDIRRISVELVDGSGTVLDSSAWTYGGVASATHNANVGERRTADPYVVRVTVTDEDSPPNEEVEEKRVG